MLLDNINCESTSSTIKLVNEENEKTESTLNLDELTINDLDLEDTFTSKEIEMDSNSISNSLYARKILDSIINKKHSACSKIQIIRVMTKINFQQEPSYEDLTENQLE